MKKTAPARRQIFVLTPDEKKAVACILATFVLGVATQHYRKVHPRPPAALTAKEQRAAKIESRAVTARTRSARRAATPVQPAPDAEVSDDD